MQKSEILFKNVFFFHHQIKFHFRELQKCSFLSTCATTSIKRERKKKNDDDVLQFKFQTFSIHIGHFSMRNNLSKEFYSKIFLRITILKRLNLWLYRDAFVWIAKYLLKIKMLMMKCMVNKFIKLKLHWTICYKYLFHCNNEVE